MLNHWPYYLFYWLYDLQRWLMYRFTRQGLILLACIVITGTAGIDTKQTLAYQIFSFLMALLGVSVAYGVYFPCPLSLERVLPRFGTVGTPCNYRIMLHNLSPVPLAGLHLYEVFGDPRPSLQDFLACREPGDDRRNPFDRAFGQFRWLWLLFRNQRVRVKVLAMPSLGPRGRGEAIVQLNPLYRGRVTFRGVVISRPDPLGFFNACRMLPLPQQFWLLPQRYTLPPLTLPGSRRYQSGGVALASSVGDAEEFRGLRDYRAGDPLRKIHWKSWAKFDKPIVREEEDEFFVRHALVLDTFQMEHYSDRLEAAVSVAASLVCQVQTQDSLLDLMFVGPAAYCFTSGRGLGQPEQFLEVLAGVTPCHDKPFSYLLPLVLSRSSLMSSCLAIFLTWDQQRRDLVQGLLALEIPLVVLVLGPAPTSRLDPLDHIPRFLPLDRLQEHLLTLNLEPMA